MIITILTLAAFTCLVAAHPYQAGGLVPYALLVGVVMAAAKSWKQKRV